MIEFSVLCLARFNKSSELSRILPLVDAVHLDIMDGQFVQNTALLPAEINNFRTHLPKHVHIMSFTPEQYLGQLQGVASVSFHFESVTDPAAVIMKIREAGFKAGMCLNPETPVDVVAPFLPVLDRVVIMAVKPGYSGYKYIPETSKKISQLRQMNRDIAIIVDGGMHEETIREVMALGATACVVCSVIVKSGDYEKKILELKKSGALGSQIRQEIFENHKIS